MHYLVLGGGISPEKEVSARSAGAVKSALEALGHTTTALDPATVSQEELIAASQKADAVFPILHGEGGEDGSLQQLLEEAGIPYLGSNAAACAVTYDKAYFKQLLEEHTLPTPAWSVVTSDTFDNEPLTRAPFVLKPLGGGSSIDTFIVRSLPFDTTPLKEALSRYDSMLIEELIEGHEVTVGVLGETPLPVIEIIPPHDKEFDYENKYNGATQELCPPITIPEDVQSAAQTLARAAHTITGCRHLSRTDMMIDTHGKLYIIDTNTIPGLTDQSLFPKAAHEAGYSWTELVAKFTELID